MGPLAGPGSRVPPSLKPVFRRARFFSAVSFPLSPFHPRQAALPPAFVFCVSIMLSRAIAASRPELVVPADPGILRLLGCPSTPPVFPPRGSLTAILRDRAVIAALSRLIAETYSWRVSASRNTPTSKSSEGTFVNEALEFSAIAAVLCDSRAGNF